MGIKQHGVLKKSLENKALVPHVEILLSSECLTRESDELPSISAPRLSPFKASDIASPRTFTDCFGAKAYLPGFSKSFILWEQNKHVFFTFQMYTKCQKKKKKAKYLTWTLFPRCQLFNKRSVEPEGLILWNQIHSKRVGILAPFHCF